jgi:hypothetical protein
VDNLIEQVQAAEAVSSEGLQGASGRVSGAGTWLTLLSRGPAAGEAGSARRARRPGEPRARTARPRRPEGRRDGPQAAPGGGVGAAKCSRGTWAIMGGFSAPAAEWGAKRWHHVAQVADPPGLTPVTRRSGKPAARKIL